MEPSRRSVRQAGVMGEFDVFGNVVLLTPKDHADRIFAQTPAVFDRSERWAAGASRLPNDAGLVYKVVGMETQPVRAIIRRFWSLVRQEVVQCSSAKRISLALARRRIIHGFHRRVLGQTG